MSPLGPKKPIKKPKPQVVEMIDGNFAFVDAEDGFGEGSEIFVCTQEEPAEYDLLESGTYNTAFGDEVVVEDGIIVSVL